MLQKLEDEALNDDHKAVFLEADEQRWQEKVFKDYENDQLNNQVYWVGSL